MCSLKERVHFPAKLTSSNASRIRHVDKIAGTWRVQQYLGRLDDSGVRTNDAYSHSDVGARLHDTTEIKVDQSALV